MPASLGRQRYRALGERCASWWLQGHRNVLNQIGRHNRRISFDSSEQSYQVRSLSSYEIHAGNPLLSKAPV